MAAKSAVCSCSSPFPSSPLTHHETSEKRWRIHNAKRGIQKLCKASLHPAAPRCRPEQTHTAWGCVSASLDPRERHLSLQHPSLLPSTRTPIHFQQSRASLQGEEWCWERLSDQGRCQGPSDGKTMGPGASMQSPHCLCPWRTFLPCSNPFPCTVSSRLVSLKFIEIFKSQGHSCVQIKSLRS